jgi:hypothetical protein
MAKTSFSGVSKNMWLIFYPSGARCKELMTESPFTFIANNFPAFPPGN